jgi:hypothetical protein
MVLAGISVNLVKLGKESPLIGAFLLYF